MKVKRALLIVAVFFAIHAALTVALALSSLDTLVYLENRRISDPAYPIGILGNQPLVSLRVVDVLLFPGSEIYALYPSLPEIVCVLLNSFFWSLTFGLLIAVLVNTLVPHPKKNE